MPYDPKGKVWRTGVGDSVAWVSIDISLPIPMVTTNPKGTMVGRIAVNINRKPHLRRHKRCLRRSGKLANGCLADLTAKSAARHRSLGKGWPSRINIGVANYFFFGSSFLAIISATCFSIADLDSWKGMV